MVKLSYDENGRCYNIISKLNKYPMRKRDYSRKTNELYTNRRSFIPAIPEYENDFKRAMYKKIMAIETLQVRF